MAILFKKNAASILKVGLNVSSVTMAVVDPSVFPMISENSGDAFKLTLVGDDVLEIIEVTSVYDDATYGTAYRIKRGQEGTSILQWPSGTRVEMRITAGGGGGGGKDGYGGLNAIGGTGGSGNLQNGGAGGKTIYCDPGRAGEGVNCSGGAGYPTSQCQGNSSVGDAPGGGACSAYGGYIAGGGGAGALGSLMEPAEWATPGWTNDSYTHPANAGAGQVGCVLIISTWAL